MPDRSWITCSFPTHAIFPYHLPLTSTSSRLLGLSNDIAFSFFVKTWHETRTVLYDTGGKNVGRNSKQLFKFRPVFFQCIPGSQVDQNMKEERWTEKGKLVTSILFLERKKNASAVRIVPFLARRCLCMHIAQPIYYTWLTGMNL